MTMTSIKKLQRFLLMNLLDISEEHRKILGLRCFVTISKYIKNVVLRKPVSI